MGSSVNHQYINHSDSVVERYVKTVLHGISGYRYDPDTGKVTDFFLSTPESVFNFATRERNGDIVYDSEVLELYTDQEVKYFKRANKSLLERGLLKPYYATSIATDESNLLDDTQIEEIAAIVTPAQLKKRLATITSEVTLNRILDSMQALGRKESMRHLVKARIEEIA